MKVLILAGGMGTRLSEETGVRPKPMVEVGGKPILWHIMKGYASWGFNEFVILLGYKGEYIKQYFSDYFLSNSDISFDLRENRFEVIRSQVEPWKVSLIDTGPLTMTGGRILRARELVGNAPFMLTYGDGVSNVNIDHLMKSHQQARKKVTMTVVQPSSRFGTIELSPEGSVTSFKEKPRGAAGWINGGFFVCEPSVFELLNGDECIFEREPLERLASEQELHSYRHDGFWKCMDNLADKNTLNDLWSSNQAHWKTW